MPDCQIYLIRKRSEVRYRRPSLARKARKSPLSTHSDRRTLAMNILGSQGSQAETVRLRLSTVWTVLTQQPLTTAQ